MGNTRVICGVMIEEAVPRWMKEQARDWRLADGRIFDAALFDADAKAARYFERPARWTEQRDPATDRPFDARGGRSGEARTAHHLGRLRRAAGRRRDAHGGDHRREPRCRARVPERLAEEKKLAESPIKKLVAAVSVGVLDGVAVLDLDYEEDKAATVDLNLVATEDGAFVEVQGAGEEATFSHEQLAGNAVARPKRASPT